MRNPLNTISIIVFTLSLALILAAFLAMHYGMFITARILALLSYISFIFGVIIQVKIHIGYIGLRIRMFRRYLAGLKIKSIKTLNTILILAISAILVLSIILYMVGSIGLSRQASIYAYSILAITIMFNIIVRIIRYFGFLRIKQYFRVNWGAPFIIAFMILLVAAAYYLSLGFEGEANSIAVYAYYMLVLGVVLQLVCYLKYGGGND